MNTFFDPARVYLPVYLCLAALLSTCIGGYIHKPFKLQAAQASNDNGTFYFSQKDKTVLLDYYFNHESRLVGIDTVRFHYLWDETDNNGYSVFASIFNKYGIQTKHLDSAPDKNNLKAADIYLLVDPDSTSENPHPNYISDQNIADIKTWVKKGGILLLFANDSPNVEFTHLNRLAAAFGVHFNYDSKNKVSGNNFEEGAIGIKAGNEVFKKAKKVFIKEFASQTLRYPAKAVLLSGQEVVVSKAKIGKGTVIAIGDPWFYNEYTNGKKLPRSFQNYLAAEELVEWINKQVP